MLDAAGRTEMVDRGGFPGITTLSMSMYVILGFTIYI